MESQQRSSGNNIPYGAQDRTNDGTEVKGKYLNLLVWNMNEMLTS